MAEGAVRIDGTTLRLPGVCGCASSAPCACRRRARTNCPPGLGDFPIRRVEDHPRTAPEEMAGARRCDAPRVSARGDVADFGGSTEPAALQVGVGKVCAVSGKPWSGTLARDPQNYVVLPRQPWLDGINSGKGTVSQFVAVPLGLGATVEGQVTGEEVFGGVQLQSFPLNDEQLALWREEERLRAERERGLRQLGADDVFGGTGPVPMPPPGAAPVPPPSSGFMAARRRGPEAQRSRCPAPGAGCDGPRRRRLDAPGGLPGRPAARRLGRDTGRAGLRAPGDAARVAPDHRGGAAAVTRGPRGLHHGPGSPGSTTTTRTATDLDPADALGTVKPVGDWLGDDLDPWQAPAPGQVKPLGDAPGKPVQDGDW